MRVISIEVLWDVICAHTDISPTLDSTPNILSRKDRHSKDSIFAHSKPYQKYHKNAGYKISSHGEKNFKNDMRLKCSQMHRFSIPNIKFFVGNVYDSDFNIFSKKCIP